jgi:chemotaxis signal transduction protein
MQSSFVQSSYDDDSLTSALKAADGERPPFLVMRVGHHRVVVPCERVLQVTQLPSVCRIPHPRQEIRGVMNLRGSILPLIDLRTMMGMESLASEVAATVQLLVEREEDHVRWIAELDLAITERRAFTLARDPHACKFGKWYDHFKTDNESLAFLMRSFEKPHAAIHAVADTAMAQMAAGNLEGARDLVQAVRAGAFREMVRLFMLARETLPHTTREVAMLVQYRGQIIAVSVDEIETLERYDESAFSPVTEAMGGAVPITLTPRVVKRGGGAPLALELDVAAFFEGH